MEREWDVYLAGEIHSDWRQQVAAACEGLPVRFSAPVTDHPASDAAGTSTLDESVQQVFTTLKEIAAARANTLGGRLKTLAGV